MAKYIKKLGDLFDDDLDGFSVNYGFYLINAEAGNDKVLGGPRDWMFLGDGGLDSHGNPIDNVKGLDLAFPNQHTYSGPLTFAEVNAKYTFSTTPTPTSLTVVSVTNQFIFGGELSSSLSYDTLLNRINTDTSDGADAVTYTQAKDIFKEIIAPKGSYIDNEFDLVSYGESPSGVTIYLADQIFGSLAVGREWVTANGEPAQNTLPDTTLLGIEGAKGSMHANNVLIGPYTTTNSQPNQPSTLHDFVGANWNVPFEIFTGPKDNPNIQYALLGSDYLDPNDPHSQTALGDIINGVVDNNPSNPIGYKVDPQLGDLNGLLRSGRGNDITFGGKGNDSMYSSVGRNYFDGGDGYNMIGYESQSSGITVDLTLQGQYQNINTLSPLFGYQTHDNLNNIQAISGSFFDDKIIGDSNDNLFIGNLGNDILTGGGSNKGDTFVFNLSQSDGQDTITDFHVGKDFLKFTSDHTLANPGVSSANILHAINAGFITFQAIGNDTKVSFLADSTDHIFGGSSITFQNTTVTDAKTAFMVDFSTPSDHLLTGYLYYSQLDVHPI